MSVCATLIVLHCPGPNDPKVEACPHSLYFCATLILTGLAGEGFGWCSGVGMSNGEGCVVLHCNEIVWSCGSEEGNIIFLHLYPNQMVGNVKHQWPFLLSSI